MPSMRANHATLYAARNNEFNHENLQLGINEAHALGKNLRGGEYRPA